MLSLLCWAPWAEVGKFIEETLLFRDHLGIFGGGVGEGEGGKGGGDHGEFLTYHCGFWVSFILSFSVWVGRVGLFGLQKWPALKTHTHSFLPPYTKLHTVSTLDLLSFSFSLGSALFFFPFFVVVVVLQHQTPSRQTSASAPSPWIHL